MTGQWVTLVVADISSKSADQVEVNVFLET